MGRFFQNDKKHSPIGFHLFSIKKQRNQHIPANQNAQSEALKKPQKQTGSHDCPDDRQPIFERAARLYFQRKHRNFSHQQPRKKGDHAIYKEWLTQRGAQAEGVLFPGETEAEDEHRASRGRQADEGVGLASVEVEFGEAQAGKTGQNEGGQCGWGETQIKDDDARHILIPDVTGIRCEPGGQYEIQNPPRHDSKTDHVCHRIQLSTERRLHFQKPRRRSVKPVKQQREADENRRHRNAPVRYANECTASAKQIGQRQKIGNMLFHFCKNWRDSAAKIEFIGKPPPSDSQIQLCRFLLK